MSDTDSSSRLGAGLVSASTAVTLTASVLGVVAASITQAWTPDSSLAFGALLGIGVGVPSLYREWDVRSTTGTALLWAVVASGIAYGFYAVVVVALVRLGVDAGLADVIAGGATVALPIAFSLYRA